MQLEATHLLGSHQEEEEEVTPSQALVQRVDSLAGKEVDLEVSKLLTLKISFHKSLVKWEVGEPVCLEVECLEEWALEGVAWMWMTISLNSLAQCLDDPVQGRGQPPLDQNLMNQRRKLPNHWHAHSKSYTLELPKS